jgi:hypothetical protein
MGQPMTAQGAMGQLGLGAPSGPGPQKRDAMKLTLTIFGVWIGGSILANILAIAVTPALGLLSTFASLAGWVLLSLNLDKMRKELQAVTGDQEIAAWMMWILAPIFCLIKVHPLMDRARGGRGLSPARPNWLYFILPSYAFAADLNDLA